MKRIFGASLLIFGFTLFATAQQSTIVPIVHWNNSGGETANSWAYLLGGVDEKRRFVDAKTAFAQMERDGKFLLFDLEKGSTGEFSLGKFEAGPGACEENYFAEPTINIETNFALGTRANWKILPRKWKAENLSDAYFTRAVTDVLSKQKMTKIPSKITQAVRADFDGDGADEVLLFALNLKKQSIDDPQPGDYSMLVMHRKVGGKVRNTLVDGSFIKKIDDYFGGTYSLAGIADLNGDGKMEIIVEVSAYEESWVKVFEMNAGKWREVKALSYYCGA